MPQITVTLETSVLMGLERLKKGRKSKFVNAAVKKLMRDICWDRLDLMQLAVENAWDELDFVKQEVLERASKEGE